MSGKLLLSPTSHQPGTSWFRPVGTKAVAVSISEPADPLSAAPLPPLEISPALLAVAERSKAWPFEEAQKIVARLQRQGARDREVMFATGYGPSGLPHIGTFGEVARTTMVRTAFRVLTGDRVPTRLICFSDHIDRRRNVHHHT